VWVSRDPTVVTVAGGTGLVTSVGNGTTRIVATSDVAADSATVTVDLVVASLSVTPTTIAFGALGSARQVTATVQDSGGSAIPGHIITWSNLTQTGAASVSAIGLVSALRVGAETLRASTPGPVGPVTVDVPVTVTQVLPAVTVTSAAGATPDTLKTTTRQRTFLAAAADSNGNNIPSLVFTWTSTVPAVATVDATGVATAVADGATTIQATSGGKTGSRILVVRRYAATFTLAPSSASITTVGGNQLFTGVAKDSVGTDLTISWASDAPAILFVAPATGTSTLATAAGNGSANVVMSGGTRSLSALVTATNQTATSASVTIGNFFFKSDRNNSQNPAVDTVAVGGTVTWTWAGSPTQHGVASTGVTSFANSSTQAAGTYTLLFAVAGTYTYECSVHGALMTGRIVVQ
jgi:plastocyanin